jgi:NAD(P)-dependent dehydrogenase (short-subunit alcohol dehydrogenase family)
MNRAPLATEPFSADDTAVTTWPEAARGFARAVTFWLATTRPDRRPHLMPVWAVWVGLFYASDRAGWITGTTMPIDGGVLAGRNAPQAEVAHAVAA